MEDDEVKESSVGEVLDNGVKATEGEKWEVVGPLDGSNLVGGEPPAVVGKESVEALREVEPATAVGVVIEVEAKVEGLGDAGGLDEAVLEDEAAANVEGDGGRGEFVVDSGNYPEEVVVEDVAGAVEGGSGEGKMHLNEGSNVAVTEEGVSPLDKEMEAEKSGEVETLSSGYVQASTSGGDEKKTEEFVTPVDKVVEEAKSCQVKTLSSGDNQDALAEPIVASEGVGKDVEDGGSGEARKDDSDMGRLVDGNKNVPNLGLVGAEGDVLVVMEEATSEEGSPLGDNQAAVSEPMIASGGDAKDVENSGFGEVRKDDSDMVSLVDGEKDAPTLVLTATGVSDSEVVTKGDVLVIAEESKFEEPTTGGVENLVIEVQESVVDDSNVVMMQSMEKERDGEVEEATENEGPSSPELVSSDAGAEVGVAARGEKLNEDIDMISTVEMKTEMEMDEMPRELNDKGNEGENVLNEHESDNFDVANDEMLGLSREENLVISGQMEKEKQDDKDTLDFAKDQTHEGEGVVEKSLVCENSPQKMEMVKEEPKDGKLVDLESTFASKRGEDEEAGLKEAKEEVGVEDTKTDAETKIPPESTELTDTGDGKGAEEAEEETGDEDTRMDEATERDFEKMEFINDGEAIDELGEPKTPQDEEDEGLVGGEETNIADTEAETETDVAEPEKAGIGKQKRGKNRSPANSKGAGKVQKATEEDVCFICFDGGELVLCDRRGCPKAYHPSCVNRDEAFFRSKGRWNCGWHMCSICEKNAYYMCYTCPYSLCKGCIKDAVILCVRGNRGFCESCMRTVMLVEKNDQENKDGQVDFDDKSSWEYLFKDYYTDLKSKLSLTSVELAEAKNPWKGSDSSTGKRERVSSGVQGSPESLVDTNDDTGADAENSNENAEGRRSKRRKVKTRVKTRSKEENFSDVDNSAPADSDWASKELLEFVMHMKNGDKSLLSQYDVQALILEYIKRNNLRDPRQKSRIICDSRLQNLFGKQRVGHFEMLKLLESHFLIKDDSQTDDVQASLVDTEVDKMEIDGNTDSLIKGAKDRKRKGRKKGDRRGPQSNLDDYAAIDMHNIGLIYLRRKLMEDLLEDIETFSDKVVGTFVRIRISGSTQKQDLYRLVQVVGTNKAAEPYKVGKKSTDITVEILNLNKTEVVSIDTISNQDFTEEECKRLRQSIKCGLLNRLTVGDILDKAMELQTTRINDWLESEIMRLSHLRDRASEKGRKKELRECVEKLQLLKTPEERQRRLEEIPEIHADPRMDPGYESEEDEGEANDSRQEFNTKMRGSGSRGGRGQISPGSDFYSKDSWSTGGKYTSKNWDLDRNLSPRNVSSKGVDSIHTPEAVNETPWNQGRDKSALESGNLKFGSSLNSETIGWNSQDVSKSEIISSITSPSLSAKVVEPTTKINESEKTWHYKDPSGKVQGPFSMAQLRKWNKSGYFPADLRIWRMTETQDDSILLTDALDGKFQKDSVATASKLGGNRTNNMMASLEQARDGQDREKLKVDTNPTMGTLLSHMGSPRVQTAPSVELPKISTERWSQGGSTNLPSPTPESKKAALTEGGSLMSETSQSPAAILAEYLTRSSIPAAVPNTSIPLRAAENNSNNTGAVSDLRAPAVSINTLQNPQLAVTSEAHTVQMHSHVASSQDMTAPLVQSVNTQHPSVDTTGWGGASVQKVEPNPSIPVPGQQQPTFGQWGVMPSTAPTHAANFQSSGSSSLPQSDPRRPAQSSQPNMQVSPMPNMPWGMGMTENNAPGQVLRPDNSNFSWGVMQGNPNMAWVGAPPVNPNMNWAANVQGPPPGNVAPNWSMPTGNPGAPVQGQMHANANAGWVGNAAIQGLPPGNANQSWVSPTGGLTSTVQGPFPGNGWAPSAGNPGPPVPGPVPGNTNQGWVPPAGNQGSWGHDQNVNRGKFSGQRENGSHGGDAGYGGGRPWNRQSSFGRNPRRHQTPCPYNTHGKCRKGASCDYLHT